MKRKMLALVMAFVLLMLQVPVSANVSSEDPFPADVIQSEAIELVNIALDQGVVPGQDSSEITSLYLSDSIPIYELLADNTFTEADNIKYYGIFDQNDVARGLLIARIQGDDETLTCEYNTFFCEELTEYKQSDAEICFIFAQTEVTIFDGRQNQTVMQSATLHDDSRGVFGAETARTSQLKSLNRSVISSMTELNLVSTAATNSTVSGSVSVPLVAQAPWDNGCWAACAVSVGSYLKPSVHLTVTNIMNDYANGKDDAKSYNTIQDVLAYEYGCETTQHVFSTLNMGTVMDNIGVGTNKGNPIIARVSYKGLVEGHFIVVRGYVYTAGTGTLDRATIMDPADDSGVRILTVTGTGRSMTFKYTPVTNSDPRDVGLYITIAK